MGEHLYYFNQNNYGDVSYNKPNGTKATVKSGGCGVVSATIAFDTLAQEELYDVPEMAKFSKGCGARTNDGTNESVLLNALCKVNKGFSWRGTSDVKLLVEHLTKGGIAICNQGSSYNVFSTGGHYVVAYGMDGKNIKVADPSMYSGKYDKSPRPKRIVKKTAYGCIVKPSQMKKATADRSPSYYLISYKKEKKELTFKAGDKFTLKANNVCYKTATRGDFYTIGELSQFYGEEKARLKKGRTLTAKAVDKVAGDVWIKVTINDKPVYILAYKKDTKKWYVKA